MSKITFPMLFSFRIARVPLPACASAMVACRTSSFSGSCRLDRQARWIGCRFPYPLSLIASARGSDRSITCQKGQSACKIQSIGIWPSWPPTGMRPVQMQDRIAHARSISAQRSAGGPAHVRAKAGASLVLTQASPLAHRPDFAPSIVSDASCSS